MRKLCTINNSAESSSVDINIIPDWNQRHYIKNDFNINNCGINWRIKPDINTKILTYSSINHTGWILIALTTSENLWIVYFIIYSTLALTAVSAIKLSGTSFINLLAAQFYI
jgi:hypothetical protein